MIFKKVFWLTCSDKYYMNIQSEKNHDNNNVGLKKQNTWSSTDQCLVKLMQGSAWSVRLVKKNVLVVTQDNLQI